ncbi:hypothetical protein C900_03133 [Fulvivirga imtechensis AK7]|uniref:Secretion system C-terminal sorting domain-containing protein n=1 Tax=Fulvivirga imtechensis AK7 TaxID=1237149 RepID=L8JS08_9BACT|nr:T9SS type A sorting domain-containing protein [Fulvivirga imtechensis]ELR71003.1 hypothetical protein C900_03133 [Fulvivirga imtechensis AK7]
MKNLHQENRSKEELSSVNITGTSRETYIDGLSAAGLKFVRIALLLIVVQLVSYHHSLACWPTGNVTWTGNSNSNWNNAANYSGNWGALPGNRDRVIIDPDNYTNAPVINSTPSFTPASIMVRDGGSLTVNVSAATSYVEIGGDDNSIVVKSGVKLSVNSDFLLSSNGGRVTLSGGGDVDVKNDLIFENNATRLVNNLTGQLSVDGDAIFEAIGSRLDNNGNVSIEGDLRTDGILDINNRVNNNSDAVLTIGGDIDFKGAASYIDNEGTITQSGNFAGIDLLSLFDNKSGGTWNWTYTGGAPDWNVVSVLTSSGTIVYGGLGSQAVLPLEYNNLVISGSGTKQLQAATTVNGSLTLSGGYVALNDADLTIGNSGSINNASASQFIITNGNGRLTQNNLGSGGRTGNILFPVGTATSSYTPLTINNSGVADNYSIRLESGLYDDGYSGPAQTANAVNKTWFIDEAVEGGSDVTLTLQWNVSDQLSGFSPTAVRIIHYDGSLWERMSEGAASGTGPFTMSASGVSSFSPFGVEGEDGVLPVELMTFNAAMHGEAALLKWATASELNNDYFTIEKTTDLEHFEEIGIVQGKGTTDERSDYEFYDRDPSYGISYYRLKQTDFDGTFTYSEVTKIDNKTGSEVPGFKMYPVPNRGEHLTIRATGLSSDEECALAIVNLQGQLVYQGSVRIYNNEEVTLNFGQKLPQGIYTLRLNATTPIVKQFVVK